MTSGCSAVSTRRTVGLLAALALVAFSGCDEKKATPDAAKSAADSQAKQQAAPKPEVTVLVTGDENGWLLPEQTPEGAQAGGAAKLMGKWAKDEGACAPTAPCENPATLVLSTGDHFNGQAISSFFFGEPTAEAMNRMGYAASAFGNHELDFGIEQFTKNQQKGGFPYLAANVKVGQDGASSLALKPFQVFERRGLKIGVIGLTNVNAPKTVMAGRFNGIEVAPYEQALATAIPEVWKAGADAVVVLIDECPSELEETFKAHADWKVDLVVGGHCREAYDTKVGTVRMFSPGRRFEKYVRAKLTGDASKPAGQRVTAVEASVVEVGNATPDARIEAGAAQWKQKLDEALGEEIGFSKAGLKQDSEQMARWITRSWLETLETDVALINQGGIRQDLPPGKITRASVYSVLPFENSLMIVSLPGEALIKALSKDDARFAGATKAGKGFKDAKGKAIDPAKTYKVATVEFLYFGGDGYEMESHDPFPTESGQVWQTPVISWTRKQQTTEKKPLESLLKK